MIWLPIYLLVVQRRLQAHTSSVVRMSIDTALVLPSYQAPQLQAFISLIFLCTISNPPRSHLRHKTMEALRTKIVIANYTVMLSTATYLFLGGYFSHFWGGFWAGLMVTLNVLNFYLYYFIPAASPAAIGEEEKG